MNVLLNYCRYSLDDGKADESASIQGQRLLLNQYIEEHPEFKDYDVLEFVDDGYSGKNFDRPGITEALEKLRSGEANTIVVKDFSRFGRNYVEVGYYLELLFPKLGVRFVSVNDDFDSNNYIGNTGGMDVALKLMFHENYCDDLSVKVKSSKHMLMEEGEYCCNYPLFGYVKSPTDKHQLIIDPEAADIVSAIFRLYLHGTSSGQIAKYLNETKTPTPAAYKKMHSSSENHRVIKENHFWNRAGVLRLLRDERYTGMAVSGKWETVEVGSHRCVPVPKEKWYRKEGKHEPIISKQEFQQVQSIMQKNTTTGNGKSTEPSYLQGLLKCECCHHSLRRKDCRSQYFFCETPKYTDSACDRTHYNVKELEDTIMTYFKLQLHLMDNYQSFIEDKRHHQTKELNNLEEIIRNLNKEQTKLYERFALGDLSKEQFLCKKESLKDQINQLKANRKVIEKEMTTIKEDERKVTKYKSCKNPRDLKELARELIKEVFIGPDGIRLVWKFRDIYSYFPS